MAVAKISASHTSVAGASTFLCGLSSDGERVAAPTSVTVTVYNAAGTQVCTGTDAAPDARGVFAVSIDPDGLAANTAYYATIAIVSGGVTYTDNLFFSTS